MENNLQSIKIKNYTTESDILYAEIPLSYQVFGKPLGTAPIVLINHALTGNSNVAGENGWWKDMVGKDKTIDLNRYTVLAFNIVGNGYDGFLLENHHDFIARDIANIFIEGLKILQITELFALVGGSLGGGIAWEMIALQPLLAENVIAIATDWKSTDWLIANCQIQEQILKNSKDPVHDARLHAMLCYRTPESLNERFNRTKNSDSAIFNVESWLLHHGKKLQESFQLSAYKLVNQLLKTIDITKGNSEDIFTKIKAKIHIIGVDSDLFFTAQENRDTFKLLAQKNANVTYGEIQSVHGHDAFLIEYTQLKNILTPIFNPHYQEQRMKIIKFGGKSLANGNGLDSVLSIISDKVSSNENISIVVSARGNTTDILEEILEKAKQGKEYQDSFNQLKDYQLQPIPLDFSSEFNRLQKLFDGVALLADYSLKIKDEVLSFGELLSAKTVSELLKKQGINAEFLDARNIIITNENFGNAQVNIALSQEKTIEYFSERTEKVTIITGFIASTENGETATLGRNGSNYTASLLANFLDASEFQNYTHVNGIYTADPNLVEDAQKIKQLSFSEANEMANFGATILHAKTIVPLLEKNINLRILNTFNPNDQGTLITSETTSEGIKSLSVLDDVALLNFEGRGLLGKSGIDARIFGALGKAEISVSIISQGSSERGIGLVIPKKQAKNAVKVLENEFENEFYTQDVNGVYIDKNIAVISMIGLDLSLFHKPYNALITNQITPLLFNNTVTGKNVSLVVEKQQLNKALNVIHGQIFGVAKKVNIVVFGVGLVGSTFIKQVLENQQQILQRRGVQLNIVGVANSKKAVFNSNGISKNWQTALKSANEYSISEVIKFAEENHLENLIAIDNTASKTFVNHYIPLIKAGFDLVSSNKTANTISFQFYKKLRHELAKNNRSYLYETNVGAGLPLIDTIKLLHESGENITKIRGVFSGSLSYLFNTFSSEEIPFASVLQQAIDKGFTEPDPREDLCGNDVARKLLILARELDLENEFEDITIKNLIPKSLRKSSTEDFLKNLDYLNSDYQEIKSNQKENHVLRYIGELGGDLFQSKGELSVNLVSVPKNSPLGSLQGSDAIFEIFTESYGDQPIVIQGAGAGAEVTARGVFGDLLRLTK